MTWLIVIAVAAAIATLARIFVNVRRVRKAEVADWDAQMVARLRSQGSDPFRPYEVDFFFALPTETACEQVRRELEAEGFSVDLKPVPESAEQPFSLHASKALRLSVPDMRDFTKRFGALASSLGGRYDGWTAGSIARPQGV